MSAISAFFFTFPAQNFIMRNYWLLILLFICLKSSALTGKALVSVPLLGRVELRTATSWAELRPGVKATLNYWKNPLYDRQESLMEMIHRKEGTTLATWSINEKELKFDSNK